MATKRSGKDNVTRERVDAILSGMRREGEAKTAQKANNKAYLRQIMGGASVGGSVFGGKIADRPFADAGRPVHSGDRNLAGASLDLKKNLMAADAANYELELRGEKRTDKDEGWFKKVVDNLSRGAYGTSSAINANQEKFYGEKFRGKNTLQALGSGFKAGFGGFGRGASLKEKNYASKTIQSIADNRDALSKGQDPGKTIEGQKKLNTVVKHGIGLTLDIFADPTTYVGVGLLGKAGKGGQALKSADIAENVEKTARIIAQSVGKSDDVKKTLGVKLLPVDQISRKDLKSLSPAAKMLALEAKTHQKSIGTYNRTAGRKIAAVAKHPAQMSQTLDVLAKESVPFARIVDDLIAAGKITPPVIGPRVRQGFKGFKPEAIYPAMTIDDVIKNGDFGLGRNIPFVGTKADIADEFKAVADAAVTAGGKVDVSLVKDIIPRLGNDVQAANYLKNMISLGFVKAGDGTIASGTLAVGSRKEADKLIQKLSLPAGKVVQPARQGTTPVGFSRKDSTIVKKAIFAEQSAAKTLLAEQALRNIAPDVINSFKIRVGTKHLAVPGVAAGVRAATGKVAAVPGVRKSVEGFQKAFVANAHIPAGLTHLRQKGNAVGANMISSYAKELGSIYDKVPVAVRKDVMKSWRSLAPTGAITPGASGIRGGTTAFTGQPVDDVLVHFDQEIRSVSQTIDNMGISNRELNNYLPPALHVRENEFMVRRTNGGALQNTGEINPNRLIADLLKGKTSDPVQAMYWYSAATNKAIARRTMYSSFGQHFGVPEKITKGATELDPLYRTLTKEGYRKVNVNDNIAGVSNMLFHPEIARGIEKIDTVFSSQKEVDLMFQQIDRATQAFKGIVTKWNPSFHTRTLIGEMFLGYLGGMKTMGASYSTAAKVMHGRNAEFMGGAETLQGLSKSMVERRNTLAFGADTSLMADRLVVGAGNGAKNVVTLKNGKSLTADQVWHYYRNSGLKSGYSSADLVRGADRSVLGGRGGSIAASVQTTTETVEDLGRMAHFIDVLKQSKNKNMDEAIEEAAEIVSKFHLDYTAVTNVEKNVMTRVFPFYKWLRLSTPLMAEVIMTQPGKALVVPKSMQEISGMIGYDQSQLGAFPGGPDAIVPEWLRDGVPVGKIAGNTNYWSPLSTFPLASSAELGNKNPWQYVTPLAKVPTELALNESTFQRDPRGNKEELLKYIMAQTPQTQFGKNMVNPTDPDVPRAQRIASFISNPGIQPNTDKRMLSASLQAKDKAQKKRKELRDKFGGNPP